MLHMSRLILNRSTVISITETDRKCVRFIVLMLKV